MTGKTFAEQIRLAYGPLIFGFDIGIASVGWAVLSSSRIIALGVRAFDAAEEPKTGAALNEHRRTVTTQRNRLKRRVLRLKKLRRLLRDAGAVPSADAAQFRTTAAERNGKAQLDPWQLRSRGMDEQLSGGDWARVLYHIVKHRGFFAARKSETVDEKKEGGKLTQGVKRTAGLLAGNWRTVGEMAAKDSAFAAAKRNKAGSYGNSFSRKLLDDEIRQLFARQRELGSPTANADLEAAVLDLLWRQKPAITGKAMLEMMARCTFENNEYRAPKCSFSAERFIWLSKLNNIKVVEGGTRRPLTTDERQKARDLPYRYAKVTYSQLRRVIGLADSSAVGFAGLAYGAKKNKKGMFVDPEEATLVEFKGWHALKKELDTEATRAAWERLSGAALSGDPGRFDAIALALSTYKSDNELVPELAKLKVSEPAIDSILKVDYTGFVQLSFKAIGKLLPHLEAGFRYDEACKLAGYDHAQPNARSPEQRYLPAFSAKEIRNPVVFRALNQARKVLNALVREYGSPAAAHVELGRDLSKSWADRKEVEAGQKEFQAEKQAAVAYFVEQIGRSPKGDELLKLRLYRDQDGQCAYSLRPLALDGDIRHIFKDGATQIDHVLPYSRSFDDSQNNKALVLSEENQNKGNRTPFEYLDGQSDSERWRKFEAWVRGHKNLRKAKRDRLLRKDFGAEEAEGFKARNLNDTRYVTRLFANHMRQHLLFAPDESGTVKNPEDRVLCPAGGFTSFLRNRWRLVKVREQSDLHHALDACVIAAASRRLIKRVSDFSRRDGLVQLRDGTFVDKETGEVLSQEQAAALGERFPQPWDNFREEVLARLSREPHLELASLAHYCPDEAACVKPVWVSRAPKRRNGGALHQETIRSARLLHKGLSHVSVRLQDLKLADLEKMVGTYLLDDGGRPMRDEAGNPVRDERNAALLDALRERLMAHGGDGKKAFVQPFYKPSGNGKAAPLVRTIKLLDTQNGGVRVRGGIADQASMWRVDVFEKAGKYFLVPIYQSDRRKKARLPNRAALQGKARDEWTLIDDSYDFCFSLCLNDPVTLVTKDGRYRGYFAGLNVNTASISIAAHDRNEHEGKDGVFSSLGVKTAKSFEKLHVDVLGNLYPVRMETRRGLA